MSYKKSGVDTQAADDWVERLAGLTKLGVPTASREKLKSGIGDYAAVYAINESQWLAASCDGVGTKLMWTELGLGSPTALAQDLVAMNANDLLCVGACPALFLDYLAIGSKAMLQKGGLLHDFVQGLVTACASTGQMLIGGETAQMPDVYGEKGFDVAGFSLGFLTPQEWMTIEAVEPGDEVWGWKSSGPHSNGFSWLRQLFSAEKDADFIRTHLMPPTELYINPFLRIRHELSTAGQSKSLHAAFHITGSGLLNFLRAQPKSRTIGFDFCDWPTELPPWLVEVQKRSGAGYDDLCGTFNMGVGFAMVFSQKFAQSARSLLDSWGLRPLGKVLGEPEIRINGMKLQ